MKETHQTPVLFFYGLLLISFLLLLGRLFELQIILGAQHRQVAEGNRVRKIINPAPRGIIFGAQQKPLVRNVPVYRLKKAECEEGFGQDCLVTINREEALRIEVQGGEAIERLRVNVGRDYIYGPALAHVLGYLGEVTTGELDHPDYKLGDLIGRTGIEQEYDHSLRGIDGGEIFEVDTQGKKTRELGSLQPTAGNDIYLSIDASLSQVALKALEDRPGAVVVTEAKTGRVLVLVSSPSFDPNLFGKFTSEVEKLLNDSSRPMFNRAISGLYPPGSVFKIVTATAGLEEGKIDENTTYEDKGFIQIGEYVYKNWLFSKRGGIEGKIGVVGALKRSTDTFFYKVGEWVGVRRLADWGKAFGLGKETGIDLPFESAGLVPDPEWKERVTGERWFLGNTYHFAIGQADLLTTPLQINMMTSIIANDGKLCQPIIAKNTSDGDQKGLLRGGMNCQDLQLKEQTLRLIKEGMKEACSPGGTAFPLFNFSAPGLPRSLGVACKTGTAEFDDPNDRTHAWLTAFAPADDPEIVITTLVEAGGEGSDVAAPIVKKVLEEWFKE